MNMQVAKNTVVTLDYSVADPDGELVDAGQEPLVICTVATTISSR